MPQDTIDVEMPDGTVIEGVPTGTKKSEVMRRYQKMQSTPSPSVAGPLKSSAERPGLWEALNKPVFGTQDIAESTRSRISAMAGKYLPPGLAGPAAFAGNVVTAVPASMVEFGRRMITPLTMMTGGAGVGLQGLRAIPGASRLLKAGTSAAETAGGITFGAVGAKEAATGTQPGETGLQEFERRVGGAGQALMGATAIGHALPKKGLAPVEPARISDIIGRSIQEQLVNADTKMHMEVGRHAEHVAKVVDDPARNPIGAIDAKPVVSQLQTLWNRYVKTYSPQIGTKSPAVFEGIINEATTSPGSRWTWEQAKQIRSAVSEIGAESRDPKVSAIASQVSKELRGQLKAQADKAGVGKDFDAYNELHSRQMAIREKLIGPIKQAISGEDVMRHLHGNLGYVENTIPALKPYGVETKAVIDAAKVAKDPTAKLWKGWAVRHAGAALASSAGLPYMLGYFGAGYAGELGKGLSPEANAMMRGPQYGRGIQLLQKSLPGAPTPLSKPAPIPPKLEAPKTLGFKERMASLPPLPKISQETIPDTRTAPQPVPEPANPYAGMQERLGYMRTINAAIRKLTLGSKAPLSETQIAWIEKETGIDMTKPQNISKARQVLIDKRNALKKD
jgi:hypothetical protein